MPSIILGLLPAIVAIYIGNFGLLLFGIFFTMAACGDFLVINLLRKENMKSFVQDHPSEAGCYIYRKNIWKKKWVMPEVSYIVLYKVLAGKHPD